MTDLDRIGIDLWTSAGELERLLNSTAEVDPIHARAICLNLAEFLQQLAKEVK